MMLNSESGRVAAQLNAMREGTEGEAGEHDATQLQSRRRRAHRVKKRFFGELRTVNCFTVALPSTTPGNYSQP